MYFIAKASLIILLSRRLALAEFFSDLDSTEHDQRMALDVRAKEFWQGLMRSAQALETSQNAKISADVDQALLKLSPADADIRELFQLSIGHLANADSMLFREAANFKELAQERLHKGPSQDAFLDVTADWEDVFYSSLRRFVGGGTYEKRLGRHIISRLKEMRTSIHDAADMAPVMLAESGKASEKAYEVLRSRDDGSKGELPLHLRTLAHDIIAATGKQRLRFTNYLLNSLMSTAQDVASKNEPATKTVLAASLHERDSAASHTATHGANHAPPNVHSEKDVSADPLFIDATPITDDFEHQFSV